MKLTNKDFSTDDEWLFYDIERNVPSNNGRTMDILKFIRLSDGQPALTYVVSNYGNKLRQTWKDPLTNPRDAIYGNGKSGPFGMFQNLRPKTTDDKVVYSQGGKGSDVVLDADLRPSRMFDYKTNELNEEMAYKAYWAVRDRVQEGI